MKPSTISQDFFIGNRTNLRQRVKTLPIVVPANLELQSTADMAHPFRQDSYFWYLTGLDVPEAILVMTESSDLLIIPDQSEAEIAFDGLHNKTEFTKLSGIKTILENKEGWQKLKECLDKSDKISMVAADSPYDARHKMIRNPARKRLTTRLKRIKPGLSILDIRSELVAMRVIKQPIELESLESAVKITKQSLDSLIRDVDIKNLSELTFKYRLDAEFYNQGATGIGFSTTVASGVNAATLHHLPGQDKLGDEAYIIIDSGAEVNRYSADITRTIHLGQPNARQKAVYDSTKEVFDYALTQIKPGIKFIDYERDIRRKMGKTLKSLGLITDDQDLTSINKYFPSATSHFLGLDVHDVGDYRADFEPGMVITCEPGIYIPDESIGIRIEEDVLITEGGNRLL